MLSALRARFTPESALRLSAEPRCSRRSKRLGIAAVFLVVASFVALELAQLEFAPSRLLRRAGSRWQSEAEPVERKWRNHTELVWPDNECPLQFDRFAYDDIRKGQQKPYLFGAEQQPECINCKNTTNGWTHFCLYRQRTQICYDWDQSALLDHFVERAELGAPGAQAMLTMTPCDLWPFIRGRTLWIVGDSLAQEYDKAMQCFFMEFSTDWLNMHPATDNEWVTANVSKEPGVAPWCMDLPEDTKICHIRSNRGDHLVTSVLPHFAGLGGSRKDIFVVNFGVWFNEVPEYAINLWQFADYVQRHRDELPFMMWRDSSVQHFNTVTGTYVEGPKAYPCSALDVTQTPDNHLHTKQEALKEVLEGGWRNRLANKVMADLGLPNLLTWNVTVPLWNYHYNYNQANDCTHTCHPSWMQVWIYSLYEALMANRPLLEAHDRQVDAEDAAKAAGEAAHVVKTSKVFEFLAAEAAGLDPPNWESRVNPFKQTARPPVATQLAMPATPAAVAVPDATAKQDEQADAAVSDTADSESHHVVGAAAVEHGTGVEEQSQHTDAAANDPFERHKQGIFNVFHAQKEGHLGQHAHHIQSHESASHAHTHNAWQ